MKWYLVVMASVFTLVFISVLVAELAGYVGQQNPALLLISSGLLGAVTWVRVFLAYRASSHPEGEGQGGG